MNNKKNIYIEIDNHLSNDDKPSEYFNSEATFNEYPFTMLSNLTDTPQSPQYHPEGSVWNHTLLVGTISTPESRSAENPNRYNPRPSAFSAAAP